MHSQLLDQYCFYSVLHPGSAMQQQHACVSSCIPEKPMHDLEEIMLEEQRLAADISEIVETSEGGSGSSNRPVGQAFSANDAMELCCTAELTDLCRELSG